MMKEHQKPKKGWAPAEAMHAREETPPKAPQP